MEPPIGYWLKLVDRLIDEHFDATLDEHGVTRRQWQVLNVLSRGPASGAELDRAIAPFLNRATDDAPADTTAAELEELIDSDWVAAVDANFALTDRGQTSFERIAVVVGEIRSTLAADITEPDYAATVRSLEKMARNLGWADE